MKNLKSNIRDFLNSEEGRVGVKAPLALGVTAGVLMFAQALVVNADVQQCTLNADCDNLQRCDWTCLKWDWIPNPGLWTCRLEGLGCVWDG
ncbi:hypothetical protein F4Y93_00555 [Candidatus Poribacteria bacterium]|nr:hypothetical protein [Candidatus Poribacteria bacterium]